MNDDRSCLDLEQAREYLKNVLKDIDGIRETKSFRHANGDFVCLRLDPDVGLSIEVWIFDTCFILPHFGRKSTEEIIASSPTFSTSSPVDIEKFRKTIAKRIKDRIKRQEKARKCAVCDQSIFGSPAWINFGDMRIDFCGHKCKRNWVKKHTAGRFSLNRVIRDATLIVAEKRGKSIKNPQSDVRALVKAVIGHNDPGYNKGFLMETMWFSLDINKGKLIPLKGQKSEIDNEKQVVDHLLKQLAGE